MDNSEIKQVFRVRGKDFKTEELAKKFIIDTTKEGEVMRVMKSDPHDLLDGGRIFAQDLCQDMVNHPVDWWNLMQCIDDGEGRYMEDLDKEIHILRLHMTKEQLVLAGKDIIKAVNMRMGELIKSHPAKSQNKPTAAQGEG